jgi:hypothetical protein
VIHGAERFLHEEARDESAFSSVLAEEGKLPWQVRQALDAVKVFRQLFSDESVPVSEIEGIQGPILQMTDHLHLRRYSRSTENICLFPCRTPSILKRGFFRNSENRMFLKSTISERQTSSVSS